MFFSKVYNSWKEVQENKYREIFSRMNLAGLVLDIGCGSSWMKKFINAKIVGIDVDKNYRPKIIASGDALPFKDKIFDAVVSIDTMHLIQSKDFSRVLKDGGLVLFSIFFNTENYNDKRKMLRDKLNGFTILDEFTIDDKENEYVVLAKNSHPL